jgi:hypothetical protein
LPSGFALPHVLAMVAACNVALYTHDAAEAARVLAATWPDIERLGVLRFQYLRVELEHLRGRVALADRSQPVDDRARIALEISETLLAEGAPWAVGLGLLLRAAALALRATPQLALAALHAAEEQFVATHMAGYLQLARMRRGVLEGSQGSHARAAAARDALRDSGVLDPDRLVDVLVPWDA